MPPKKKLTKKEKARLEAEQAELLRIEMEKEKLKKLEEARQRKQIELEQAKQRQKKEIKENKIRRAQLQNSMEFFHKLEETISHIKAEEREQYDWEKYMRCNGLPNANKPSDLRKYIHQWQDSIAKQEHISRNWLLCTNERTLLTHDSNMPDLSRSTLRKKQGNLGDFYARRAKEVLGILTELDNALVDESLAQHIRLDLIRLKMEIRVFLKEFLDAFTYKTLSHIERDMEIDRPGVCKHIYESSVFKNHIWAFAKDAQLSANPKMRIGEQNPHTEIEFGVFEMLILLPPSLMLQSSAIRGLWLNYDHLSDYCPSFNPKRPKHGKIDILMQTKKEWRKRKEILKKKLDECANEDPLSFLEQQEEEEDAVEPSVLKKKFNFDVDKVYTEYEDELSKQRRIAIGPKSYGLSDTDVNLRKYRIIGGVYGVDYLETPQQDKRLNSRSFIRTVETPNSLTRKNFYQLYKPPPPVLPGVRRLPEEIEAELRMVEAALDKLALVTLQLPDSVIWFEPPIVCRWETTEETLESELMERIDLAKPTVEVLTSEITPNSTTNPSPSNLSPRIIQETIKLSSVKSTKKAQIREICDFDMHNIPPGIDIQGLMKDFVLPRLPVGFRVCMSEDVNELKYQLQNAKSEMFKSEAAVSDKPEDFESVLIDENSSDDEEDLEKYSKRLFDIDYKKDRVLYLANANNEQFPAYRAKKKSCNDSLNSKDFPPRINEDFLDLDEPRELFPRIEFDKVLKFKELTAVAEDKLQLINKKDSKSAVKNASVSAHKTDCQVNSPHKFLKENKTYLFSELLKDLDKLCELQQVKEMPSLKLPSDDDDANNSTCADLETIIEPIEQQQQQQQPHASLYPYYQSISFIAATASAVKHDSVEEETEFDADSSDDDNYIEEDAEILAIDDNEQNNNKGTEDTMLTTSNCVAFTQGKWSTRDVHDTKFNEDKLSIQFRTGRLGVFGFALNRYSNMPYQTWEIKPDLKNPGTVRFSFTASYNSLEMTITSAGYCLNNFQGGSTASIDWLIGRTVTLSELKNALIYSAVDIFPDEDAFCYTEGSCEKNYVMEMHLYACMSTLTLSHNFSWSRWNLLAGSRTAVLLMRELIEGKKVPFHSTLLVTPLKTSIIDCTEVSASFNAVAATGMEFYADLYQLSQVHAQPVSLQKQRELHPILRDNVAQIMMAIRPLSFC